MARVLPGARPEIEGTLIRAAGAAPLW